MAALPPIPPEDDRDAGGEPRAQAVRATWGPFETILGTFGTVALFLFVGSIAVGILQFGGVDLESYPALYGLLALGNAVFVAGAFAVARLTGGGAAALGFVRPTRRDLLEGAAIGAVLIAFTVGYEFGMQEFAGDIARAMKEEAAAQRKVLEAPAVLFVPFVVVIVPLCEEVFFRGFLFGGLRRRLDFALASGLSAAIFGLVHWMRWSTIPLFVVGLGCALAYERRRTIWAPFATHLAFNGLSVALYPFL